MMPLKHKLLAFKYLLIALLVTFGISAYALATIFSRSPEPSAQSIKLGNAGVVADFKFEVKKHFIYSYSIAFHFPENDQLERARIRKIVGGHAVDKNGKPLEPGVPTPINLTIFSVCKDGKEVEVYSKDADPILTSWGSESFVKNIGSQVMNSGMYRARITNKRASPEFSSIPITFEMGMPAKINFDPVKESSRSEPCQR
jgi:Domain of unknown function (DUF5625)